MTHTQPVGDSPVLLYVEDDILTRQSVSARLTRRGLSVHAVESGEEALKFLEDGFVPAALLLDLQLPGMDGIETYTRMRQDFQELPVVVCSAHLPEPVRSRLRKLGIPEERLLVKPCPFQHLLQAVEQAMDAETTGGESETIS